MSGRKQRQLKLALQTFYKNPIARVSLELFLTVATILFFAIVAIKPTLLTTADLIKEIEDKEELDKKLSQKMAALASAQLEYQMVEDKLDLIDQAIPSSAQLLFFLKTIEKICSEELVIIESMNVSKVPEEFNTNSITQEKIPDFSAIEKDTLSVRVGLSGDYQSIRNIVERLRKNRRLMLVEGITFSVLDNRGEKTLKAFLSIGIPYYDVGGQNIEQKQAVVSKKVVKE